jgi:hypothetical protein
MENTRRFSRKIDTSNLKIQPYFKRKQNNIHNPDRKNYLQIKNVRFVYSFSFF